MTDCDPEQAAIEQREAAKADDAEAS